MKEDTSLSDLTPTTLKTITQIFESSDALDKIHTIENDGFLAPEPPMVKSEKNKRKNLIKLESTSLQGGTVIVHTPTKSENLTILDPPMKSTQPIKTMQTRSSNRYVCNKLILDICFFFLQSNTCLDLVDDNLMSN